MYMYVYTCTHTHTRTHKHAHTYTLSVSLSRLSFPYTHACSHIWMDLRHRIGLKNMIIKSLTSNVNCASDSFLSMLVWLSRARRELESSESQTISVSQCLSAWQIPCVYLQVSASVRACVCLFDLLEVKQYLSTCVCLPDEFCVSIAKSLPLCGRVFVYLCVFLF